MLCAHWMEASQARLLSTIAEVRSFSAAAAALGVSQPSISQQAKRIEGLLGCRLFVRSNSGVELTSAGEAAVAYARAMLSLGRSLRLQLAQNAGRSRISIGMSQDVCRTALPSVLASFANKHADVELRVVSGSYETIARAIEMRSVDLAVTLRNMRIADLRVLWTDSLVWIGRGGVRLPISRPVPLILPMAPDPRREIAIRALKSAGYAWRIALESDDLTSIEAALQAGIGITVSPLKMKHHNAVVLDASSGLPELPCVEYAIRDPLPDAGDKAAALAAVIRGAAASGFRLDACAGLMIAPGRVHAIDVEARRRHPPGADQRRGLGSTESGASA